MVGSIVCAIYIAVGGVMLFVTLRDPENREDWIELDSTDQIGYSFVFLFLWPLILIPSKS